MVINKVFQLELDGDKYKFKTMCIWALAALTQTLEQHNNWSTILTAVNRIFCIASYSLFIGICKMLHLM